MNPNIPELPKHLRPASNDARKSGCTRSGLTVNRNMTSDTDFRVVSHANVK